MALSPEVRQRIIEAFPSYAWLMDIPEVGNLMGQAVEKGWGAGEFQSKLQTTKWWRTHSESQRQFDTALHLDKATVKGQITTKTDEIRALSRRIGAQLTQNEIRWLATWAIRDGADEAAITRRIITTNSGRGFQTGVIHATQGQLKTMAENYGVAVRAQTRQRWATEILTGSKTLEALEQHHREQALRRYQGHAGITSALNQGLTVRDYMQPIFALAEREMGVTNAGWSLTRGRGAVLTNWKDPETGAMGPASDQDVISWARRQPEWRSSINGSALATEVSTGIAEFMGGRAT